MLRMLSICSCLMNRMQDKITMLRYVINPLKVWRSLNIGEQTLQINITFMNKLRTVWTQGECLMPFGPESFVFWFTVKKYGVENIQTYSCACCFVVVRNLVSLIEGRTKAGVISEYVAEETVCA